MNVYCPCCKGLLGTGMTPTTIKDAFPRGCPFCCGPAGCRGGSDKIYHEVAKKAGANFVDEQGKPIK